MTDAFIYEHLRTPRGKGKKDGGLHQATPIWLLRTLLQALQQRLRLDTALVDDVVLVGDHRGRHAQPLLRLGARSGEPGRRESEERAGRHGGRRRRGIDEPLAHGQRWWRLGDGPARQSGGGVHPAGPQR